MLVRIFWNCSCTPHFVFSQPVNQDDDIAPVYALLWKYGSIRRAHTFLFQSCHLQEWWKKLSWPFVLVKWGIHVFYFYIKSQFKPSLDTVFQKV